MFIVHFRSIFGLVKILDEKKNQITNVHQLFSEDFEQDRLQLIKLCEQLMIGEFENLGRKAREILWRKAYYEPITLCRKIFNNGKNEADLQRVKEFLDKGLYQLKRLVVIFERKFGLKLKDTINLELLKDVGDIGDVVNEHFTKMEISYAWDIVHATLISIGDMYRYCLSFELDSQNELEVTRETATKFYEEAFKINATIGMAQNQLGTLFVGQNYNIDSIYHYLFALSCKVPFELSEGNVSTIFQQNAIYLESNEANKSDPDAKIKNFVARFILLVDIFYYDKDIDETCDLCRAFLVDIKLFLDYGGDSGFLNEEVLFKIVAIFLFCLNKLTQSGSKKVHSLNAVLVAFTSEIVDCANRNYEQFLSCKEAQNLIFSQRYNRIFEQFEEFERENRNCRNVSEEKPAVIITTHPAQSPDIESDGRNSSNKENDGAHSGEIKKRPVSKGRRQRRRRKQQQSSEESDDDDDCLSGEIFHFDSDSEADTSDTDSNISFKSYDDSEVETSDDDGSGSESEEENVTGPEPNKKKSVEEESSTKIENDFGLIVPFTQLSGIRFRRAYKKVDPNILIEFCSKEKTLKAMHLLFDWLSMNTDVLVGCYVSNPEFIHKIMRLVNNLNIDIFTRKVYFDRSFIIYPNLRTDLRYLFDIRQTIPITEDVQLKWFILLHPVQQNFDWELDSKIQITTSELMFLRMFRLIDFGFYLSKLRKFHYFFCAKSRVFIEKPSKNEPHDRSEGQQTKRHERNRENRRQGRRGNRRENRNNRIGHERREREGRKRNGNERRASRHEENKEPKKRYLKNKLEANEEPILINGLKDLNLINNQKATTVTPPSLSQETKENGKTTGEKMGELWLRNEVRNLENKVSRNLLFN